METMREFASVVSWPVQLSQWNSLDTHDTPRLRTVTQDPALDRVACAFLMTYPGTPMLFAGLELGASGLNGEYGRIPMPWDRPERWDAGQHEAVRDLVHLRNDVRALREGGMRWALVHDDALAFLRETADERVLVLLARAPWSGAVLPASLASLVSGGREPENLFGGERLPLTEQGLELPGTGPGAQVWRF
jgi:alpha-glucosidase